MASVVGAQLRGSHEPGPQGMPLLPLLSLLMLVSPSGPECERPPSGAGEELPLKVSLGGILPSTTPQPLHLPRRSKGLDFTVMRP